MSKYIYIYIKTESDFRNERLGLAACKSAAVFSYQNFQLQMTNKTGAVEELGKLLDNEA